MDKNTKVVFDRLENIEFNSNTFINLNGTKIDTKEDLETEIKRIWFLKFINKKYKYKIKFKNFKI